MSASEEVQGSRGTPPHGAVSPPRGEWRALLATCVAAAALGAERVREGDARRASLVWETKGRADFVSDVDRASEAAIAAIVRDRHPGATLLAEEGSPDAQATSGLVFVADPLDGTTNFLHGVPWYAVSVAALVDGALVAGAIVNAATNELFTATAGGGARRAGQPMRVSGIAEPARALVATGFPFSREEEIARYLRLVPPVMRATSGLRRAGAAALDLADVACGRYDAFFELRLSPWDIAAGLLLVREAGGVATTLDGAPCPVAETSVVAGNPAMHAWLLETLKGVNGEP